MIIALCHDHDEVRILIFDDPAENERGQRPEFCSAQLYSTAVEIYIAPNDADGLVTSRRYLVLNLVQA